MILANPLTLIAKIIWKDHKSDELQHVLIHNQGPGRGPHLGQEGGVKNYCCDGANSVLGTTHGSFLQSGLQHLISNSIDLGGTRLMAVLSAPYFGQ